MGETIKIKDRRATDRSRSLSGDTGVAVQTEPMSVIEKFPLSESQRVVQEKNIQKPNVVFQGKGKVILFKNSQFKDGDQFLRELVRCSEPMNVYVEDWTVNGMADWSYKTLEIMVKILHFIERVLLPHKYTVKIDGGKIKLEREYSGE